MGKSIEEVFGKSINTTRELRAEIIRLQEGIGKLGTDEAALKEQTDKLVFGQEALNKVTAAGKQATDFAKDSILGMEKEYKNLYNTYKMLTDEQRQSDFGKNMAASLAELSEKLNTTKKDVGNFKDNIGHYSQGVIEAFGQMGVSVGGLAAPLNSIIGISKGISTLNGYAKSVSEGMKGMGGAMKVASSGAKTLGASLKTLIANPVGAVIMAAVVAFKAMEAIVGRVSKAIKGNEETQMRLKEAMSAFQPIINAVTNAFDWLAQRIVSVIEVGAKAVTWLTSLTKKGREAAAATRDIAKSQNELTKRTREYNELNADDNIKVQSLREQAAATTDNAEKVRLLTEAKEAQERIDQRNLELAQENLRILEEEAAQTANDAEMNEKLSKAKIAVANATAAQSANIRKLTQQITTATNATVTHTGGINKEKQELDALLKTIEDNSKTEVEKLTEKYEKEKALLEKYHKDTTKLTEQYNANLREIQNSDAEEAERKRKEQAQIAYEHLKKYEESILNEWASQSNEIFTSKSMEQAFSLFENADFWEKNILGPAAKKFGADSKEYIQLLEDFSKEENILPPITNVDEWDAFLRNAYISFKRMSVAAAEAKVEIENLRNNLAEQQAIQSIATDDAWEKGLMLYDIDKEFSDKRMKLLEDELANFKGTEEEKLKIELELIQLRTEAATKAAEAQKELDTLSYERFVQMYDSILNTNDGIGSLAEGYASLYKAQIKDGKLTEEQSKKKQKALENLQKVQTATAIASVVGDTAAGIGGIWRGYAAEKVANAETAAATGPAAAPTLAALNAKSLISAILNTASMAATGLGQIASIRGNHISAMADFRESGEATATAVSPSVIDVNPYTYTRTLQTEEEEREINRPIWVAVQDIQEGINKVEVTDRESAF